jgi:ABC-2 type transport system ATP-binding protein
MRMAELAIDVDGVSRWFGRGDRRVTALSEVSFAVESGSIVALLGENGAGKTTLTKILATLLVPSAGQARLFGHDVATDPGACRRLASVVFGGERGLYEQLPGRDNLRFFGMLAGVGRRDLKQRVPQLLEQVGLNDAADRKVETYSKGMKQRLHIAIGFIARPRILLLDEPTVGLDPMEADRLRGAVSAARDDGVTILLTSHNLLDVERLASRVVLLERGVVTQDLPLAEFVAKAGHVAAVTVRGRGPMPGEMTVNGISPAGPPEVGDDEWMVRLRVQHWGPDVFGQLAELFADSDVLDVQVSEARLEEAFANVTSAGRSEAQA